MADTTTLDGYNPEFDPSGIEGGIDTNALPWTELPQQPGLLVKPLRASSESGFFSMICRLPAGEEAQALVFLGGMDLTLLSGGLRLTGGELSADLYPGVFGYVPANTRVGGMRAEEDAEFLCNCYGAIAFMDAGDGIRGLLTARDVQALAGRQGVTLVPNTLAECMQPRSDVPSGRGQPLAIAGTNAADLVDEAQAVEMMHAHFIDTRSVPWIVNPDLPDIALKVLRVSEETGIVSLVVRHNGVAGPHYHLGAADFLVLSGRIGYRAGPPEGYGPGVWFFEPAGARHEATQRIGEDDLIYTANVYGPIQFDSGRDTPIVAVQSWMQYKALADASGVRLVRSSLPGDATHLAWAPLGSA